jgi:hypothetical protein
MSFITPKLVYGVVFGLMLFLASAANCLSASYDVDDDDSTPPVTVDLRFVCSSSKNSHSPKSQVEQATAKWACTRVAPPSPLLAAGLETDAGTSLGTPQLLVPLRR